MELTDKTYKPSIAQVGQPVLRQKAKVVEDILAEDCQQLIKQMMSTVEQAGGVGIAAPQIFQSLRVFIMCSKPNARYPNAPHMEPTAIINPEIMHRSTAVEKDWEGCLSVPSMRGLVPRHKTIKVRYFDQQANEHEVEFTDFVARIFQHELDHLDGLTFIDRLESTQDLVSESYWYQHYAPQSSG